MTKVLGLLALLVVGCSSAVTPHPKPPGLSFQPQPVPLPKAEPEYLPPPVLLDPEPRPEPEAEQKPLPLPNPRLVAALAVFDEEGLLQCTELYGFSNLPYGPPEMDASGLRLVPIGRPCRRQFENQFIPAMCGNKVSEETRKNSNMVWEQNYYFDGLQDDLGLLEENCTKEGGAWWDEVKGGRYPDFLLVYPTPQRLEMF